MAKILREDFLAQNAYSPYDPCCPFYKSVWMLKNIILFFNLATKAVELSGNERKISLNAIKNVRAHVVCMLSCAHAWPSSPSCLHALSASPLGAFVRALVCEMGV